jgi:hypothetical protein
MDRDAELEALLRKLAPLFHKVSSDAQAQSAALRATDWCDTYVFRDALVNRIVGTARWGLGGDGLVAHNDELAALGVLCSCTHEEQNQGRYYWQVPPLGMVLTVGREVHKDPEDVNALQMQIGEVLERGPRRFPKGALVVYLAIPPFGDLPRVEVALNGGVITSYTVDQLLDQGDGNGTVVFLADSTSERPKPRVGSSRVSKTPHQESSEIES